MATDSLRDRQRPLEERYERDPDAAKLTLTATADERDDLRACSVDVGRAVYEAQLHEGAGGPGTGACSGDLLLGALAACTQLTAQAVAHAFDLDVDVDVTVAGDLDLRGTMGVDGSAPVGFEDIRVTVDVSAEDPLDQDTVDSLRQDTERYCVVLQTLASPPAVQTTWTVEEPVCG